MPARKPVHGTAKLWMRICVTKERGEEVEEVYRLEPLQPVGWRLHREHGPPYDVQRTEFGFECDCADFLWCREHKDPAGCKHCCALRSLGLI